MSDRRQVWATLAELLQRLASESGSADPSPSVPSSVDDLKAVQEEVRRLGKAQFKANTLAEHQAARWDETLGVLQTAVKRNEDLLAERPSPASQELLQAIIPALDGLEQAIANGQKYLGQRDKAAANPHLTPAQTRLVSPADRAVLAGWLDGLRLIRERLLAVLEAGGVTPIPTVGKSFDPFLHKAVGIAAEGQGPSGTITAEERPGYRSVDGVLRYVEVIVYKSENPL
jgi:molecular chaperone GrpE